MSDSSCKIQTYWGNTSSLFLSCAADCMLVLKPKIAVLYNMNMEIIIKYMGNITFRHTYEILSLFFFRSFSLWHNFLDWHIFATGNLYLILAEWKALYMYTRPCCGSVGRKAITGNIGQTLYKSGLQNKIINLRTNKWTGWSGVTQVSLIKSGVTRLVINDLIRGDSGNVSMN